MRGGLSDPVTCPSLAKADDRCPERKLWRHLRNRELGGWKFRRQYPVGSFIVDFICVEKNVVIEVDGGQHAESEEIDLQRSA